MMEEMKEYGAYIFDLYGTLIDIHTNERKASLWKKQRELFSSFGAGYEWKELRDSYFGTVGRMEEEKKEQDHYIEIDIAEVFRLLLRKKGIESGADMIRRIAERFRRDSVCHIRLYAGAKDLLKALRNLDKKVFLLSNAQELFTGKELEDLGIDGSFDDIFISSACGYRKPDPSFMERLLQKHGLDPKDCLMIGNDLYDDVCIAARTGMDSYYIESALSSERKTDAVATYVQKGMDLKLLKKRIVTSCEKR